MFIFLNWNGRNKDMKICDIVYWIIGGILIIFLGAGLLSCFPQWHDRITYWYVRPIFWGYVFVFLIYALCRKTLYLTERKKLICLLFVIAAIPRIILLLHRRFVLISDYELYVNMGKYLITGQKEKAYEIVEKFYGIPKYGGLSVLMALIGKLFSTELIGYQIANIIMSSFICVMVYLIVEKYSKNIAIFASFLMVVYPADIIASQVVTNREGAVLFTLLACIYLQRFLENKKLINLILGAGCLMVSDFWHPSVIVSVVAFFCFGIVTLFENKKERKRYFYFKSVVIMIVSYFIFVNAGLLMLRAYGVIDNMRNEFLLPKIVIGFNHQTRGTYSEEDAALRFLPEDEQEIRYKELFHERILEKSPIEIFSLIKDKVEYMWFAEDGYFYWYEAVWKSDMEERHANEMITDEEYNNVLTELYLNWSFSNFDLIYVEICYFFAIIGIAVWNRGNMEIQLISWILLGQITIHFLIEVQSRYRDVAMPYIMIFSAIGFEWCYHKLSDIKKNFRYDLRMSSING